MIERVPPQSMDAEQSVLGSMMIAKEAVEQVREILTPEDFYRDSHGLIYETIIKLHDERIPVDMVTLTEKLRTKDCLDMAGGVTYVASLANIVPTSANATYYANIVREKSLARKFIIHYGQLINKAYHGEEIAEVLSEAEKTIFDISMSVKTQDGLTEIYYQTHDVFDELYNRKASRGIVGIPTGFKNLDIWTAGFQPGQLIVVAGRPAMGKTSWAIQVTITAALKHKKRIAIYSLETKTNKLIEKMLINQGKIDAQRARLGKLNEDDREKLVSAANLISQSGILINDSTSITVHEMLSQCRKAKLEKGLDMIVVDYIQQIDASKEVRRGNRRDLEIAEITRGLKKLGMELGIPVIALSQLSRAVELEKDKKPNLSHLKESGAIEADADTVIFLYRPEYYFPDTELKGITEVILAKQREGPVGTVQVMFQKEFTSFTDLDWDNVTGR